MHLTFLRGSLIQEDLDSGQIFQDDVTNELELFIVVYLLVFVYLGGEGSKNILNVEVVQHMRVD